MTLSNIDVAFFCLVSLMKLFWGFSCHMFFIDRVRHRCCQFFRLPKCCFVATTDTYNSIFETEKAFTFIGFFQNEQISIFVIMTSMKSFVHLRTGANDSSGENA